MPRVPPVYSDFFHSPLTEDVEELLARFQQTDSVRYQEFAAIWREMSFSDIFAGITRAGELKRFCRVMLATAMKFFLPPYSYQIRVGGLYLMFAFYHTQPVVPPVQIRLALRDWASVQKFLGDSVESGHQDVVYIYQKLVAARSIHYTAMPHVLTFQKQRKPKKESVCTGFLGRTTAVQDLLSSDALEELSNIQSQYEKLKEATEKVSSQVNMTHRDLVSGLNARMSEFITWQQKAFSQNHREENSGDDDDDDEKPDKAASSSRARLLSSIKQKSYKNFQEASKARRHRQAQTVESSSSGVEQVQEAAAAGARKKVLSLRARTWNRLGKAQKETTVQAWLLSAPELQDRVPVRRANQAAPLKP